MVVAPEPGDQRDHFLDGVAAHDVGVDAGEIEAGAVGPETLPAAVGHPDHRAHDLDVVGRRVPARDVRRNRIDSMSALPLVFEVMESPSHHPVA